MAATGVRTFNGAGMAVTKFNNDPIEPGYYDACIKASRFEERKADGVGKLPYLNGPLEVMDTGVDGGKNRWLYIKLWTCVEAKPGKDSAAVQGPDQILALAAAMGEALPNLPVDSGVLQALDEKATKTRKTDILNPKAVLQWLKNHDGQVFKIKIKTERGTKEYPGDKSVLDAFIEADGSAGEAEVFSPEGEEAVEYDASTGEVFDASGETEAAVDYQEQEQLPEEEPQADFEPIPPPRRAAPINPGPRVQQGPLKNGKAHALKAPPPPAKKPVQKQARR